MWQENAVWSPNASLSSSDAVTVDLEPGDAVTSFDYLMEKEALLLGTSNGLLLLHNVDDASDATQVVGKLDGGVNAVSLSPDGELVAVTTGFGQLLVMTHDWDVLYETSLHDDDVPVSKDHRSPNFNAFYTHLLSTITIVREMFNLGI